MSVGEGDKNARVNCHSCGGGGVGFSAIKQIFLLILLFLSGSIIPMTINPVSAELGDLHRSVRSGYPNFNSDSSYNYLSRALERLHFGPLLKLRSISSMGLPNKFVSDLSKPKEKKALSYLSRFYPLFQPHGSQPLRSLRLSSSSSSRRRTLYPQSSETGTYSGGRLTRPMRLRWGK